MAILEAGVMFGGVPIVKKQYYEEQSTDIIIIWCFVICTGWSATFPRILGKVGTC